MPMATIPSVNNDAGDAPQSTSLARLVVCFDGTGNQYLGDTSDTNIVKLYQKFDRGDPKQFHYYQRKLGIMLFTVASH